MNLGITVAGVVAGGVVGAVRKKNVWTSALWGGAGALLAGVVIDKVRESPRHKVGELAPPFSLPTPALPGQMDYAVDPRADPRLDPVSREQLYPAWLLAHWQRGDRKIISETQHALGIPADGLLGAQTATAIRSFQARGGLPATGVMDYATMQQLILG